MRESCWKLHGQLPDFFKGNGGRWGNFGYKSQANLAENGGKQQEERFGQEMKLNKEKIDKLKKVHFQAGKTRGTVILLKRVSIPSP